MQIENLELINFRNFSKKKLEFSPVVLILGPNGRGKTNILEAIYILSTTKSFRTNFNTQLINFESDFTRIIGGVVERGKKNKYEMIINKNPKQKFQKKVKINSVQKKLFDVLGLIKVVIFSPESIEIILGAPQERRRFLDIILSLTDRKYAQALATLFKIIRNRNYILGKIAQGQGKQEELSFWDIGLAKMTAQITIQRYNLLKFINQKITDLYKEISGENKNLKIKYCSGAIDYLDKNNIPVSREKLIEATCKLTKSKFKQEIQRQTSLTGPQRDELIFSLSNHNLKYFGARGEVRSAILATKMAELQYLSEQSEEDSPILLLDDVFSELDTFRRQKIINIYNKSQVIITATDTSGIDQKVISKAQIIKL